MNRFAGNDIADRFAYTQMEGREAPPNYWRRAEEFALSDDFFASAQGPSFPNHLYTIAAQSGGSHHNPFQDQARATLFTQETASRSRGDATRSKRSTSRWSTARGRWNGSHRASNFPTEADLLDGAGIPWGYYAAWNDQRGYVWSAFSAIERVRMHPLAAPHLPGRQLRRRRR